MRGRKNNERGGEGVGIEIVTEGGIECITGRAAGMPEQQVECRTRCNQSDRSTCRASACIRVRRTMRGHERLREQHHKGEQQWQRSTQKT